MGVPKHGNLMKIKWVYVIQWGSNGLHIKKISQIMKIHGYFTKIHQNLMKYEGIHISKGFHKKHTNLMIMCRNQLKSHELQWESVAMCIQ